MAYAETEYLMTRAKEEAIAAIQAEHPSAAAAHQQLSLLYSTKAIIELTDDVAEGQPPAGDPDLGVSEFLLPRRP